MKKFLLLVVSVVTLLTLTSCGKFTCTQCGQEKSGKQYTIELAGIEYKACEDCHELIEAAKGAAAGLLQ